MPAGLIEENDRMRARSDLGCDFVKMQLHGLAVAGRQHEGGAGPAFGTIGGGRNPDVLMRTSIEGNSEAGNVGRLGIRTVQLNDIKRPPSASLDRCAFG